MKHSSVFSRSVWINTTSAFHSDWLLIRGWVSPVVRIELSDPSDPTPYWIVSTRSPAALVAAIASAKAAQNI